MQRHNCLGGTDSFVNVANHTVNDKDTVVGYSNTSDVDLNGEYFLWLGPNLICLAFVRNGVMTALPSLRANNGQAWGSINGANWWISRDTQLRSVFPLRLAG
jgi:hypothetical protein